VRELPAADRNAIPGGTARGFYRLAEALRPLYV
jgi:hypothetical protein